MMFDFDWKDVPHHPDECEHPADSFVGSRMVMCPDTGYKKIWHDIYIFPTSRGPAVCIRIGSEPEEYISPGTLWRFLTTAHQMEEYGLCAELMMHLGYLSWSRKKGVKAGKTSCQSTESECGGTDESS